MCANILQWNIKQIFDGNEWNIQCAGWRKVILDEGKMSDICE